MTKGASYQCISHKFLQNFTRCSFTLLVSTVLLSKSMGVTASTYQSTSMTSKNAVRQTKKDIAATPLSRSLLIAQQPQAPAKPSSPKNEGLGLSSEELKKVEHDCATAAGSSGSPIVGVIGGDPYIVALNNGEAKNLQTGQDIINFAVKISTIEEASRGN